MDGIEVKDMPAASVVNNSDLFMIVQSDVNKKATKSLILNGTETTANKVVSISSSSTDTQYPSAKCVYDLVGEIAEALDIINGEVI